MVKSMDMPKFLDGFELSDGWMGDPDDHPQKCREREQNRKANLNASSDVPLASFENCKARQKGQKSMSGKYNNGSEQIVFGELNQLPEGLVELQANQIEGQSTGVYLFGITNYVYQGRFLIPSHSKASQDLVQQSRETNDPIEGRLIEAVNICFHAASLALVKANEQKQPESVAVLMGASSRLFREMARLADSLKSFRSPATVKLVQTNIANQQVVANSTSDQVSDARQADLVNEQVSKPLQPKLELENVEPLFSESSQSRCRQEESNAQRPIDGARKSKASDGN